MAILALLAAACETQVEAPPTPTVIVFPTATPGTTLYGVLPTPDRVAQNPDLLNPSNGTPSPTPNTAICPPISEQAELNVQPDDPEAMIDELLRYLSAGGDPEGLADALRESWDILGEDGFVRADFDLDVNGTNEVIIGYTAPEDGGTLLIAGCQNRRYVQRFHDTSARPTPPELLSPGDINRNGLADIIYTFQRCPQGDESDALCEYRTQIVTWQRSVARFTGLIPGGLTSRQVPDIRDTDGDAVQELVLRLNDDGNIDTGPLRTGLKIYDWNGVEYVLSIVQPEPLRYRIQVIHQADRYFAQRSMSQAVRLYQQVLTDNELEVWLRNETPLLESYTLYRLLLARAFNEQSEAEAVYQRINEDYPQPEAPEAGPEPPVYADMARVFWEDYQVSRDMSEACNAVRDVISNNPEAVDQLNRYGQNSPTYTTNDLCPF